ncbi:MAG: MFS transporter [Candidatus Binatia bacterium]|nr:MFS transporter [Candidatus Binatia bacterium]
MDGAEGVEEGSTGELRLSPPARTVFALGDLTVNTALSALSIVYTTYFLTQVTGLRPILAGLIPFVGRIIDAVTDPLMGRLSDHTNLAGGRRRPYFLIGAIPFGASFALLWIDPGFTSQWGMFAYYAGVYCILSVSSTVVSVPYLALIPEMATDYDDRTSLNTYRAIGAIVGVFCAIALRPVAAMLGGGPQGFAAAGAVYGAAMVLPWFLIHRVTFERPEFAPRAATTPVLESFRIALRRRSFVQLMGFYLTGRVAMDLVGAMLILYFTYWLGRGTEFELAMSAFLLTTIFVLPVWLRLSLRRDKGDVFRAGCAVWMVVQGFLVLAMPDTSDAVLYGFVCAAGIGYGAVDLMPWAMLGEVIDEDELETGERREGLYNGLFMFLRKLAGALVVLVVLGGLDLLGFAQGETQNEVVRIAILLLATIAPAVLLGFSIWLASDYPITRATHARILGRLHDRKALGRS